MVTNLGPVILDGAASPLVETQITRRNVELAGKERDDLIPNLRPATREPAVPAVMLEQYRETQRRRATPTGEQNPILIEHSPKLDQLVLVDPVLLMQRNHSGPITHHHGNSPLGLLTAPLPTPLMVDHEAALIRERTQAGLIAARSRGRTGGRKPEDDHVPHR